MGKHRSNRRKLRRPLPDGALPSDEEVDMAEEEESKLDGEPQEIPLLNQVGKIVVLVFRFCEGEIWWHY